MPGDRGRDAATGDGQTRFLCDTYCVIVDTFTFQMNERFPEFTEIAKQN